MSSRLQYIVVFFVGIVCLQSCQFSNTAANDKLLARVNNKSLHLSELEGMFPAGISSQDSSLIIDAFVNRWVREAVVLSEAERNIPQDLNIDKLVRDYRASLILHSYERILIEELLDSNVTQAELKEFYERNKEQYQLEIPIVRCQYMKFPMPVSNETELRQLWNSKDSIDRIKLLTYGTQEAVAQNMEDSTWYRIDDVSMEFPTGTLTTDNINSKREFIQKDDTYLYFFRAIEVKNSKEIAPLAYIEDQARKYILHRRKLKLLEDKKADMYELELRRSNIEVFTD
ncbi:MAG: hypothetical protein AAF798_20645 [Bacteroidota bacterium]